MTRSDKSTNSRRETSATPDLSPLVDDHLDEPDVNTEFVEALAAFDDALIHGNGKAEEHTSSNDLGPLSEEIENAKKCVLLLQKFWQRPSDSSSSESFKPPTEMSSASQEEALDGGSASPAEGCRPVFFGRFAIIRELGRGGGGIVYHAVDTKLKRGVALKLPRPEFVFTSEMRRRFLLEAQTAAGLKCIGSA